MKDMTYIKRKSAKQEKRTAKEFSGRTQIASGAIEGMKADVRTGERISGEFNTEDFLIENKYTDSNSYKLTLSTWNKVAKEAFRDNFRTPLMQIDIQDIQVVVFDETLAESMGFVCSKYHESKGKSYSMSVNTMDILFKFCSDEVLLLDFTLAKQKLYVTSKDDFLRRLS